MVIDFGKTSDIDGWMELVREISWNFPGLETEEAIAEHRDTVLRFIGKQQALCAKEDSAIIGVLLFLNSTPFVRQVWYTTNKWGDVRGAHT